MNFFKLYKFIKSNNINTIYLNSFFSFYENFNVIFASFFLKFEIILAPRGQIMYGAIKNRYYLKLCYLIIFKYFFLKKINKFHFTSLLEYQESNELLNYKVENYSIIENISFFEINDIFFDLSLKKVNELSIVFYSRIVPKKNLIYLIQILKELNLPQIKLYIYGIIEDQAYWDSCLLLLTDSKIYFEFKGKLTTDILYQTLNKFDIFVFPTHSENFGHVIIEAMTSGLPILISTNTPFTYVNDYECGWAIDLIEKENFKSIIYKVYKFNNENMLDIKNKIRNFLRNYNKKSNQLESKYYDLFKK